MNGLEKRWEEETGKRNRNGFRKGRMRKKWRITKNKVSREKGIEKDDLKKKEYQYRIHLLERKERKNGERTDPGEMYRNLQRIQI